MNSVKIAIAAFAALAFAVSSPAFANDAKSPIIGAWKMTSLEVGTPGNLQAIPYSGQLVFTKGGTLSVKAMNPDANAADTPYTTKPKKPIRASSRSMLPRAYSRSRWNLPSCET